MIIFLPRYLFTCISRFHEKFCVNIYSSEIFRKLAIFNGVISQRNKIHSNLKYIMTQIELVRREIVHLNLKTKELIQEIKNCKGPIEVLNELNHEGRKKISLLRNNLNLLKTLTNEEIKPEVQRWLLQEVKTNESELSATIAAFQQANFASLLAIDTVNRKKLFNENEESLLKHRKKSDKESLIKMSSDVTDQLLSISRSLCDSTQRSASTLDTLVNSSTTADGTKVELVNTGSVIVQSGKLLAKYGRREKTDKVLVFFAFIFFLACVFYVIQKRLF